MSYNGSGTFTINTTGQPVVAGTVISSSAFNSLTNDLATGLTTAITKDGQTTTTARITFAQGLTSSLVTDSSSISTGSIITAGGLGVAKALYVGTTANVASTTDSSSISTGSIVTAGGVGIAKNLYVGVNANVAGTLNVTGATTLTNPVINNIKMGYSTTATAAGTTTLTISSNYRQFFTGTLAQTIVLPVTSTLVTGIAYEIENNSTGLLTVNSSGGNLVGTVPAGVCAHAVCIGTTLTTAADWDWDYISTSTITGTGANVLGTSPTITSPTLVTPALGTPASADFTTIAATQAQQETATTLTAPVTPGRQQYHPSAAKGWVTMNHAGTITGSYNVTSVTDLGTGVMRVDLTTSFSSTSYCVVSATDGGGGGIFCGCTARATGSFTITTYNTASQVAQEAGLMFASAFGDQ